MFRGSDLSLITKTDLLAYIEEFKPERARQYLRQVGYAGPVIELTKRGGEGFDAWLAWLREQAAGLRGRAAQRK
jgi:hydrogenase nickel incorporation protein HypB